MLDCANYIWDSLLPGFLEFLVSRLHIVDRHHKTEPHLS
jgi:hypothetical protein